MKYYEKNGYLMLMKMADIVLFSILIFMSSIILLGIFQMLIVIVFFLYIYYGKKYELFSGYIFTLKKVKQNFWKIIGVFVFLAIFYFNLQFFIENSNSVVVALLILIRFVITILFIFTIILKLEYNYDIFETIKIAIILLFGKPINLLFPAVLHIVLTTIVIFIPYTMVFEIAIFIYIIINFIMNNINEHEIEVIKGNI